MSQTKAQLIQPIGVVTASGVVVSGVMTAATFDGDIVGSATSIIQGTNLNLGAFNATSFAGDFTGNATGIITSSAIKVGQLTASSFVGDFTGTATSMMRGTGFEAGAVTGSSFVANVTGNVTGNATGLAGSVTQGTNIHVGVLTATSLYGDGSNLTGIAATNYNTQTVNVATATTTIDLSAGNVITFNQSADTTVSFANTSEAMSVTLIRDKDETWNVSYSTGVVDFDGTGDYLSLAASSDLNLDADFTIEAWVQVDDASWTGTRQTLLANNISWTTNHSAISLMNSASAGEENTILLYQDTTTIASSAPVTVTPSDGWTHIAITRSGSTIKIFKNGVQAGSTATSSVTFTFGTGETWIGQISFGTPEQLDGKVSNLRIVKGTALYTDDFVPPSAALTNVTNTKLLCCQSDSSTTTAAVTPGTITANGDPTAGAQTISTSGTVPTNIGTITWPDSIKWNGGSAPTLITDTYAGDKQQFQFLTRDSGVTWYAWESYKLDVETFSLFGWGQNDNGQIGENTTTKRSSPVQIPGTGWSKLPINSDFSSVNDTLLIKGDNTLWSWGQNNQGNLGHNNETKYSSPTQVGTDSTWSKHSISNTGVLAIKTNGTLWAWGQNSYGSLGLNQTGGGGPAATPGDGVSSPTQVGSETNWSSIGSCNNHVGGVKTDGTLWTWGWNYFGVLGQNFSPAGLNGTSSPTQVGTDTDWSLYTGAEMISYGLKTDGSLWAMGYGNRLGQNQPSGTTRSSPVQIPGTWKTINASSNHILATKTNGTLWSWGYATNGGLGQNQAPGSMGPRSSPIQIGTGTDWKSAISGDNSTSVAVKTDGTMWVWGMNYRGQLGLNEPAAPPNPAAKSYSSPTQLPGTSWEQAISAQGWMFGFQS